MNHEECEFEADVLAAVLQSRWPEHVDAKLRDHVASCPVCSEVVVVAGALDGSLEAMRASAEVPDASRVWWQAQLRARREAVQAAGRPITAVQMIAFACAMGLLGACIGATSTWFQWALKRIAGGVTAFDLAASLTALATLFAEHGALMIGLVAAIFLVPTAVYFVLARD